MNNIPDIKPTVEELELRTTMSTLDVARKGDDTKEPPSPLVVLAQREKHIVKKASNPFCHFQDSSVPGMIFLTSY